MIILKQQLQYIFLLFVLGCNSLSVKADEKELNFINISSKQGLSSNTVNAIIKDRYGFLWFATDDGLNKFDGKNFTIYRHNSSGLISNEILDLYEDVNGNLWIGTGAGIVRYNRKSDSFINYPDGKNQAILSISGDSDGNIWIGGYQGLEVLNIQTKRFISPKLEDAKYKFILDNTVTRLLKDKRGHIWIGTSTGLYRYNEAKGSVTHFAKSNKQKNALLDNAVNSLCEDKKGNIWIATANGLSMFNITNQSFINYQHNPSDIFSLSSNMVYAIDEEPDGAIWVGTEEGLNIISPETKHVTRVNRSSRNNFSLIGKAVKSIMIDNQGIYWVATFRGGVNKYDKNLAFFNLRQSNPYDPKGLNVPVITSFVQADNTSIYVGTDGGGLNLFDMRSGTFHKIKVSENINGLSILAMEKVNDELWIGTFSNGLFIVNTKTGQSRQVKKGVGPHNISGNDIFCIKRDSRGNVWMGTNGQGIDCYDFAKKVFVKFGHEDEHLKRVQLNGFIRAIEEDKKGNIWIGSCGAGIAVYNPISGYSKIINKTNSNLPSDNISTIYPSTTGEIWLGLPGYGLVSYSTDKDNFIWYSEKDGLANDVVYKILEDEQSKLWLSTNKGISSFDVANKTFKNYSSYNGVQKSPFVHGAGLKLADGRLFFGGTDGFNYFNPKALYLNRNIPRVVFTDLKVANQSVLPSKDSYIEEHISIAKEINLDYKQNFSLSFAALNYTSPQENRYFYKLENFDKEWNSVGEANTAIYTNLSPGEYVFQVKASSDAGEWSTPITSIKVNVRPPFWLTVYAYILYFCIIVLSLWYMRHRGIQRLKAKFALEQERLQVQQLIEQERKEAERIHEFDQLKIKFLTNISHEFRTPISLIMGPVEQLLQQETSLSKSSQLNMIRRNSRRLLNLVNQLLDFRNIKQQEQKLCLREGDLVAFSKDVAESFRDLAERKLINFEFKSTLKYYFASFDHDKLERVLFNLLSNAFKFTLKNGTVSLYIDPLENSGIKITLSDTGIGIEDSAKEKIFNRFFQSKTSEAVLNQGSGVGLCIAREFVKLHGGTIEVESIVGKGTVFTIKLPLQKIEDILALEEDAVVFNNILEFESNNNENDESGQETSDLPVVLLVEDNEDFRSYLKESLKKYYRIVEAGDGKEGWQKVLSAHPQLVVSDISMPYVSGVELCKKIKSDKRTNHIPVLLLTALTGEEDELLGLKTGANDYMAKPFNFDILYVKIQNLLALNESFKNTYSKRINLSAFDIEIESDNEKLLSKIVQYIEANLTNPRLSVEDLSKHIGMSRGSLYSKVLNLTGQTPVEYIRTLKLDRAAVLLEKSEMNISQICYSVGFATPNYFARAFKSKFDMLPSEYLNLKRTDKGVITK